MLNFIVLGQIPGTSIQLDFTSYLLVVVLLGGLLAGLSYLMTANIRRRARQIAAIRLIAL